MSKNPSVSIVIPCYNMGQFVGDAISSVMEQVFTDFELIVVDDGSTDTKTIQTLKKLNSTYPQMTVYYKKNSGLPGARNYGINKSKGKYICCLDADDKLDPRYIEKTVAVFLGSKDEHLGIVTTWLQEFGIRSDLWKTSEYNVPKLLINNIIHVGSLFKKEAWDKVSGYKKDAFGGYEDWNFWLDIVSAGYKWSVVEEPIFFYRIREGSMLGNAKKSHTRQYENIFSTHRKLFEDNFDKLLIEFVGENKRLHDMVGVKNSLLEEVSLKALEEEKQITKLREQLIDVRGHLHEAKEELYNLKNGRIIGKVITARKQAGSLYSKARKTKSIPRATAHKVRVVVTPMIPNKTRQKIKKAYFKVAPKVKDKNSSKYLKIVSFKNEIIDPSQPLVSIVIPYYNRASTIDDTFNSLKEQTFTNFEVIVVDDGSNEKSSIDKLHNLPKLPMQTRIITQKNQGVAVARNNGIENSKGKYIVCLDSDDLIGPTFIEKNTLLLEANPEYSISTTDRLDFGVINEPTTHTSYDALNLFKNNMVITAAEFTKEAWKASGGYKSGIGYEDWEYWLTLAENGFWGKLLPEQLFHYRTSMQSRYVEDKDAHWGNIEAIHALHPNYKKVIKKLLKHKNSTKYHLDPSEALINFRDKSHYNLQKNNPNVLIMVPWMTFGGAETLIVNFCREIKDNFNLSFITGLESENEWEYKFREISENIYHLNHLFKNSDYYLDFISNFITTRGIDIMHIIHTSFVFDMLEQIRLRHPGLKIITTVFNDRAHFSESIDVGEYIDLFATDNHAVEKKYNLLLADRELKKEVRVIPNGIDSTVMYNPDNYSRISNRDKLELQNGEIAVFFVGRLSEEKNPNIFVNVAQDIIKTHNKKNIKFFVIGDGGMRQEIEESINKIGSENIKYLGYQSEVAKYLSAADIFVLPSSIEGFPLSILEAMAMKVAVISSDVGAVSEVLTDGTDGFVVTPGNTKEIAEVILKLEADAMLLQSVKLESRKKVEQNYSNTILGKRYTDMYKSLKK